MQYSSSSKMAHRKVDSQCSVPFSWEEKPGVSKYGNSNSTNNTGKNGIILPPQKSSSSYTDGPSKINTCSSKISSPPSRSSLIKGLRWCQDDPFAAAMRECTKNIKHYELPSEGKNISAIRSNGGNKKLIFSCKKSFYDVREDNLVRLPSNLLRLPLGRKKLYWGKGNCP